MKRKEVEMKRLCLALCLFGLGVNVQAFDKNKINLEKDFWGTWSVFNAKAQCTETYEFKKPGQFTYTAKQKKLTGEFAVITNNDSKILDLLVMNVKTDNKKVGCSKDIQDYTNGKVSLSMKWISAKTAELCVDREAKQCTGLYMIKQK